MKPIKLMFLASSSALYSYWQVRRVSKGAFSSSVTFFLPLFNVSDAFVSSQGNLTRVKNKRSQLLKHALG